jgi:Tol biopolymer transport system component
MSQLGGAERQVSASGTQVAWAGDSKSVLIRDREGDTGPFGIYRVFLDTLERRRLTQAPVGAGDWKFEVSPDGSTLAFIRYEKVGIADLYVVPMDGGEPRRLSNWNGIIDGVSWTPNGREIVYSVDEPTASRLWRIPQPARHLLEDCRLPTSQRRQGIRQSRGRCWDIQHALCFRQSPATSTFI